MDDFNLRDMLSPPMRFHAEEMAAPVSDDTETKSTPSGQRLAMAYVPDQMWEDLFEPEDALQRGTIFRQLELPFEGRRGR